MRPVIQRPCLPLVIGAPRSGFVLCLSVLQHLVTLFPPKGDLRQGVLNLFVSGLNDVIASGIRGVFARHGMADKMVYNGNFQQLRGGPSWLRRDGLRASFRKYIGMVGAGDLSLNVSHPRQVLDQDRIVSSHTDPALWVELPEYADYVKFSSIRNPPGILNSACFSLNALTSEHIQRFLPKEKDNDEIRLTLGVYKLTDLTFFEGLADFLKTYFDQFMPVRDRFHIMRWEDLITDPVPTIKAMGQAISLDVADPVCAGIWAKLDHVNLTGHHKHNYRAGKGIVGDWQRSLTNHHLEIVRKKGLEPVMKEFGYGPIQYLDESQYTDYQKEIDDCIRHGEVRDRTSDRDLFGFAFNKSNINADKFQFRRFPWKTHTQLERSCFGDLAMEQEIWEVAEDTAGRVNAVLDEIVRSDFHIARTANAAIDRLEKKFSGSFDAAGNSNFTQSLNYARELTRHYFMPVPVHS